VKLTDAQLVLLSRAIQRDDGALEIPDDLKGNAWHVLQLRNVELTCAVCSGWNSSAGH
jgi:hypothetical protein